MRETKVAVYHQGLGTRLTWVHRWLGTWWNNSQSQVGFLPKWAGNSLAGARCTQPDCPTSSWLSTEPIPPEKLVVWHCTKPTKPGCVWHASPWNDVRLPYAMLTSRINIEPFSWLKWYFLFPPPHRALGMEGRLVLYCQFQNWTILHEVHRVIVFVYACVCVCMCGGGGREPVGA